MWLLALNTVLDIIISREIPLTKELQEKRVCLILLHISVSTIIVLEFRLEGKS